MTKQTILILAIITFSILSSACKFSVFANDGVYTCDYNETTHEVTNCDRADVY